MPSRSRQGRGVVLGAILLASLLVGVPLADAGTGASGPIAGGWNLDAPASVATASAAGVNASFSYSHNSPSSRVGRALRSMGIGEIDGALLDLVARYECHRLTAANGSTQIDCSGEPDYATFTLDAFDQAVAQHLQLIAREAHSDPAARVIGYWILDDWPYDIDPGGAIPALEHIHALVAQYTPGVPTICGFGATLGVRPNPDWWDARIAANFTAQGCDRVGLYIYSQLIPSTAPPPSSGQIDWTMNGLLPPVLSSLRAQGWDMTRQPLIGIGQAFGGTLRSAPPTYLYPVPGSSDITTQAAAFCAAGATGVAFYAWHLPAFVSAQNPQISATLAAGVQSGLATCRSHWTSGIASTAAAPAPQPPRRASTAGAPTRHPAVSGQTRPGQRLTSSPALRRSSAARVVARAAGTTVPVQLWGDNTYGQLGDGSMAGHTLAASALNLPDVQSVTAGGAHALALGRDGSVWAWGIDDAGEVGQAASSTCAGYPCVVAPGPVPGLSGITAIAAGQTFSLALKRDGTVWAWGANDVGQLGAATTETCLGSPCSQAPIAVATLSNVVAIAASYQHALALRGDGTVWAWGLDDVGQLGATATSTCGGYACAPSPVQVPGLPSVRAIAAGSFHSLAVATDGSLWAWGLNDRRQLGVATTSTCASLPCSPTPVPVTGISRVSSATAGAYFSLALDQDGVVWGFGDDLYGQLGAAAPATCLGDPCAASPVAIPALPPARAIAAGESHALALLADGSVWTWGLNDVGQLGVTTGSTCGGYACSPSPVQVPGLNATTAIAAGADSLFSAAIGSTPAGSASAVWVDPLLVSPGGQITYAWTGVGSPNPDAWAGLYDSSARLMAWQYLATCSQTEPTAPAGGRGACVFQVPPWLTPGPGFHLELTLNNQTLAAPNTVTVAQLASHTSAAARGASVTLSWSGVAAPNPYAWIGLYDPVGNLVDWIYLATCSQAEPTSPAGPTGTCPFTIGRSVTPGGGYEFRLTVDNATLVADQTLTIS